jgi:hypothetical protein
LFIFLSPDKTPALAFPTIVLSKVYIHGNSPTLLALTLKIEAACASEALEPLPTSTGLKDSRVESTSKEGKKQCK